MHEYDVLAPFSNCGCPKSKENVEMMHQQRVMQFLSGINDSYDQARMQILMKTTAPNLNQAYAMIIQDESQQTVDAYIVTNKVDAMAMQAGTGRYFRGRKQFMECEHCHMRNHIKENCYKHIGYPYDFDKRKKAGAGTQNYGRGKTDNWKRESLAVVNHADVGSSSQADEGGQFMKPANRGHYFTDEQYS
nr:uncharacterized protein LOC117277561 [Nicotiana tomentosiformis]